MAQTDIVLEVIDDLKKKIDELKNVGNGIDGESAIKINEIKQKAINVLSQASNKIIESAKDLPDSQELEKGLEIIKNKSKELYENATSRINKIINDANAKNNIESIETAIESIANEDIKEEVVEEPTVIEDKEISNLSYEAIEILKGWLKPEVK